MSKEDVSDGKTIDLIINFNQATRDQYPPGMGYVSFQNKTFVVGKHGVTGQIVVLGIRDPKFLSGLRSSL